MYPLLTGKMPVALGEGGVPASTGKMPVAPSAGVIDSVFSIDSCLSRGRKHDSDGKNEVIFSGSEVVGRPRIVE
jgi:hypothetical protein